MRLENIKGDDDQKPSADPHEDFELALQWRAQTLAELEEARERHRRLEEATEQRLTKCTMEEEAARRDIRSRGEAEFDSLFVVWQ